jgi:hypothetical protein
MGGPIAFRHGVGGAPTACRARSHQFHGVRPGDRLNRTAAHLQTAEGEGATA